MSSSYKKKKKSKGKSKKGKNDDDVTYKILEKNAYLFVVSNRTLPEVYKHKIFGLPAKRNDEMRKNIIPFQCRDRTPLYLWNKTDNWISGPYYAERPVDKIPIVEGVWNNKFPSHVKIYLQEKYVPRISYGKYKLSFKEGLIPTNIINKIMNMGIKMKPIFDLMCCPSKPSIITKKSIKTKSDKDKEQFLIDVEKDDLYINADKEPYTFKPIQQKRRKLLVLIMV